MARTGWVGLRRESSWGEEEEGGGGGEGRRGRRRLVHDISCFINTDFICYAVNIPKAQSMRFQITFSFCATIYLPF